MFQTAGTELVEMQAEAMGLPIIIQKTKGEKESELKDLEKAFVESKKKYQIEGIVSGALFSTYQRDRIENICDKLGLKIFSPLWHKPQDKHLQELLENGFEIVLTSVAAEGLAGATVDARRAKMGDALSSYNDGIISAVNALAAAAGVRIGMTAREAAKILVKEGYIVLP